MPAIEEKAPFIAEDRIADVTRSVTYTFTVSLYEYLGKVNISWSHNCPARPQDAWVALYRGSFPSDPNNGHVAWTWTEANSGHYSTNETWGRGWCAAMVAKNGRGEWVYVVQTPVT